MSKEYTLPKASSGAPMPEVKEPIAKRDDNVYMFKVSGQLSITQRHELNNMFKSALPKDAKVILLQKGTDYIPPDNEVLMKRMDDIEHKINKMMSFLECRMTDYRTR